MNQVYYVGCGILGVTCASLYYIDSSNYESLEGHERVVDDEKEAKVSDLAPSNTSLENIYLPPYSIAFLADWLQGSYIYALYKSMGYNLDDIALLFVLGFFSSAFTGPFVGKFADKYGRRLACSLFCIIYALSCLTKLTSNYNILMLGRLLGGVSTSLLHTTFESWLVASHHNKNYDPSLLSGTFAKATFLNGLMAILSGFIANVSVSHFGLVSPFIESTILLVGTLIIIQMTWSENYGGKIEKESNPVSPPSLLQVTRLMLKDPAIMMTMAVQSIFESSMYVFVLLWTPIIDEGWYYDSDPPYGIIFSSFMLSIMIGSSIFKMSVVSMSPQKILSWTLAAASVSFATVGLFKSSPVLVFISFNVFEMCCGLYFPSIGAVRAQCIPEKSRSTMMNILRIPMNLLVVVVLLNVKALSSSVIFVSSAACLAILSRFKYTR